MNATRNEILFSVFANHFDAQRGTERIAVRITLSNRRHSGSFAATNRQYAAEWFM